MKRFTLLTIYTIFISVNTFGQKAGITIGNSNETTEGTIRYKATTGFEGLHQGNWSSLLDNQTQFVSVTDFGADNTGAIDATNAVLLARIEASSRIRPTPIYFPPGVYKLQHSTFVLQTREKWIGAGKEATVLAFYNMVEHTDFGISIGQDDENGHQVEVSEILFLNAERNQKGTGILLQNGHRSKISNIDCNSFNIGIDIDNTWIVNAYSIAVYHSLIGVRFRRDANAINFFGVILEGNQTGVYAEGGYNVQFFGGVIEGSSSAGIVFRQDPSWQRDINSYNFYGLYLERNGIHEILVDAPTHMLLFQGLSIAPNGAIAVKISQGDMTVLRELNFVVSVADTTPSKAIKIGVNATRTTIGTMILGSIPNADFAPFVPSQDDLSPNSILSADGVYRDSTTGQEYRLMITNGIAHYVSI